MRALSDTVKTLLTFPSIKLFYLINISALIKVVQSNNQNQVVHVFEEQFHTSVPGGVTMRVGNADHFYTDDHGLLHIDPPRMSSVVDRESYKITYADPTFIWRDFFEQGIGRTNIIVRVGFYNMVPENDNLVINSGGAVIPRGYPLTGFEDTIVLFSGSTDTPSYSIDADGEASFTLECSSPMGPLGLNRMLLTTQDSLKARHATDTSFKQVLLGSKGIDLVWGKNPKTINEG